MGWRLGGYTDWTRGGNGADENTILEMNPIGNTEAKKGDTIEVKVSGGVAKINVPDLRDYEINYIKDLLT